VCSSDLHFIHTSPVKVVGAPLSSVPTTLIDNHIYILSLPLLQIGHRHRGPTTIMFLHVLCLLENGRVESISIKHRQAIRHFARDVVSCVATRGEKRAIYGQLIHTRLLRHERFGRLSLGEHRATCMLVAVDATAIKCQEAQCRTAYLQL